MHINKHFVRLTNAYAKHRGCGVLVNNSFILTCSHVVETIRKETPVVYLQIPNSNYPLIPLIDCEEQTIKDKDLSIFKLKEPLDFLRSNERLPLLTSGFSKLFNRECRVYIDADIEGYRLKSKKAIIMDDIKDYLMQCNEVVQTTIDVGSQTHTLRKENEYVRGGYSGSPVYIKDNDKTIFIGIIKMADSQGTFHIITSKEIQRHLNYHLYSSEHLFQEDFSGTNKDHVLRKNYFDEVNRFLNQDAQKTHILFVCGVSGIGKTSIIKNVCKQTELDFIWIDCRWVGDEALFREKLAGNAAAELLILDGVNSSHVLFKDHWLKNDYVDFSHIILTSSESRCYDSIFNSIGHKQQLTVNRMAEYEGLQLLEDIEPKYLGLEEKKAIYHISDGIPLFIQFIKDIALSEISAYQTLNYERNNDFFQLIGRNLSHKELSEKLFKIWISRDSIGSIKKEIIFILSEISNVGMTIAALDAVLTTKKPYKKALDDLIERGFVTVIEKPLTKGLPGHICCVHDLIRRLAHKNIGEFNAITYNERFVNYVRDNPKKCELITRIDALILDMVKIWEQSMAIASDESKSEAESESICEKLHTFGTRLDKIIPFNSGTEELNDWIADRFSTIIAKNCSYLIGMARTFSNLSPSPMIAQMMWCGLEENISSTDPERQPDALARGNLISSAFSHWRRLESANRSTILQNVRDHWIIYDTYVDQGEHDLEVAAMLGGLVSIKMIQEAMEIVHRDSFKRRFSTNRMAYLTMIIGILEHGSYSEREKYLPYFLQRLDKVYESEAKNDIVLYLKHQNHDFGEANIANKNTFDTEGLSRTVSFLAFSKTFDDYILNTLKKNTGSWV